MMNRDARAPVRVSRQLGAVPPRWIPGIPLHLNPTTTGWSISALGLVSYFGVNVAMAFAAQGSRLLSTIWALGSLLIAVAALLRPGFRSRVPIVLAHIAGAELIWRGTHAFVFWEYGKYCFILILGLALALDRQQKNLEIRALAFLALLAPALLALSSFKRVEIAFNLSGPICLGLAILYFSGRPITRRDLGAMSAAGIGPTIGLAALSTFSTITADPDKFIVGGKLTTAGIGANQVSSVLGFGLFLAVVLLLIGPRKSAFRFVVIAAGLWLAAQTILSFSRGGLYTVVGASIVMVFPLMKSSRGRWVLAFGSVFVILIFRFVIVPVTDSLSHGLAGRRIVDTNLTGRDKIVKADWEIFLEHPVLGVGPGQSYRLHAMTYRASNAHTEYTRLLAEHGVFGVMAILLLLWIAAERWFALDSVLARGIGLGLTTWALLYMGHSAMRLVLPAFCFGLGGAHLMIAETERRFRRRRGLIRMSRPPDVVRNG